jgi:hypothetical protein
MMAILMLFPNSVMFGAISSNRENAAIPDEHREHGRVGDYSTVSEDVAIENLFERT